MRRLSTTLGLVAAFSFVSPLLADTTSLQSILINVNGTQYNNEATVPGVSLGSWDGVTGLGTISFTYNPGPGSYFFDVFFDHQLN